MKIFSWVVFVLIASLSYGQARQPLPYCQGSPNYEAFYVHDSLSFGYGIRKLNGENILSSIYKYVQFESTFQDSCHVQQSRAIVYKDTSVFCLNLESNKRSSEYKEMYFYCNMLIAVDSSGWVLLDPNMNQVGIKYKGVPAFFSPTEFTFTKENPIFFEEDYVRNNPVKVNFNKHILSYTSLKDTFTDSKCGLANVKNGITIGADYDVFVGLVYEKVIYYWGFKDTKSFYDTKSKGTKASGILDIYSSDLKKITRYTYGKTNEFISGKATYQTSYENWLSSLLIFPSKNGKIGAVNSRGDLVIPFKNDSIKPYVTSYDRSSDYQVWNNGKVKLYNNKGNLTIRGDYFEIIGNQDSSKYIVRTDTTKNSLRLLDASGNIIIDNCNMIYYESRIVSKDKPRSHLVSFEPPYYTIIKDSVFYFYDENRLIKYDTSNFEFNHPLTIVNENFLVNSAGEIKYSGRDIKLYHDKYYSGIGLNHQPFISSTNGTRFFELERYEKINRHPDRIIVHYKTGEKKSFSIENWEWE